MSKKTFCMYMYHDDFFVRLQTLLDYFIFFPLCCFFFFSFLCQNSLVIKDEAVQKAVKRARTRGARTLQAQDPNIMQGSGKWKPVCLMPGRKPGQRPRPPLEINQRKERHNLKERDRR